jgi:hypothetical protein
MNKYSLKIYNFLNKHLNIKLDNYDISNTNIYNKLYKLINNTKSDNYKYTLSKTEINKIHTPETHPLLYTLFKTLNKYKLIDNLDCDTTNFTNYMKWHREFYCNLDISNLQQIIIKSNISELLDLYNIIYKPDKIRLELHELYTNRFVSLDILQFIETIDLVQDIYTSDIYELVIFYPKNQNIKDIMDLNKIIHILTFMYELNKENTEKEHNSKIKVGILLCNQKKYLPNMKNLILSSDNVNSGSTFTGSNINIWRCEEIYKVLIHELIHFYRLDFDSHNNMLDTYFNKLYNIVGKNYINEAITETLANIINLCLVSYYNKTNINNLLNTEILFSLFQSYKLFDYVGYNNHIDWSIQFKQNTSVFSYYIIKCALLYNIVDFIKLFEDNIYFISQTNKSADTIEKELIELITKSIDKIIKFLELNHTQMKHSIEMSNGFVRDTMRMTCYG